MSLLRDDEPAWPDDAVEVGRVIDAWGIKGGFKVLPFSADPQALFSSKRWFVRAPEGRPVSVAEPPSLLRITSARDHGDVIVAMAQGIADRGAAEALAGCKIYVSRASFPSVGSDEFYWIDLIGLTVLNREGETLGTVAGLLDTGAHAVLQVGSEGDDGKPVERLIPFVAAYVDDVDLPGRRIRVDWGLDY